METSTKEQKTVTPQQSIKDIPHNQKALFALLIPFAFLAGATGGYLIGIQKTAITQNRLVSTIYPATSPKPTVVNTETQLVPTPTAIIEKPSYSYHEWQDVKTNPPFDISLKTPTNWQFEKQQENETKDWGITLISPDKLIISLCIGCQDTYTISLCGLINDKCRYENRYQISNNSTFDILVNNDTDQVVLSGLIKEKSPGGIITIRAHNPDNKTLTEEQLSLIWKISLSVKSN